MSTESGAAGATGALSGAGGTVRSGAGGTVRNGAGGFLALAGIAEHLEGSAEGDHWAQAGLVGDGVCLAQGYLSEAWATPIIAAGLVVLTGYNLACGFPFTPDVGDKFAHGAAKFGEIGQALDAARPTEDWTGSGSDSYLQRSRDQRERAQRMADADEQLRTILADQARQISAARDVADQSATVLGLSIPVALALLAFGPLGFVDSELVQITAVAAALGVATPAMEKLMNVATVNAARILTVAGEYSRVSAEASRSGPVTGFGPSPTDISPPAAPHPTSPPAARPDPVGAPPSGGTPGGPGAPSGGFPAGGAAPGADSGDGAVSSGGGAAPGGGSPGGLGRGGGASLEGAVTSPPALAAAPASIPVAPAAAGAGAPSGGLPGGAPGGGGPGLLGAMLGPATQAATQALGQAGQGTLPVPAASGAAPGPGTAPGTRPAALVSGDQPAEAAKDDAPPDDQKAADGAGPGGQGTRAPIHVEIELDPNQVTEPVHVVLDPKNTAPGPTV